MGVRWTDQAARNLESLRRNAPLVHCVSNLVSLAFVADALLAAGASAVMAHDESEVEEITSRADALALNIGTLTPRRLSAMVAAGRRASVMGKPVVMDPVGVGAAAARSAAARRLMATTAIRMIRGNASEIICLAGGDAGRGVDARHPVAQAQARARSLAKSCAIPIAVTGEVDFVTDGVRAARIANGHPLMSRITGCGCAATALVAAFMTVDQDVTRATATALAYLGLAGEKAARCAAGPGAFRPALLDALYALTPERLAAECRIMESGNEP